MNHNKLRSKEIFKDLENKLDAEKQDSKVTKYDKIRKIKAKEIR